MSLWVSQQTSSSMVFASSSCLSFLFDGWWPVGVNQIHSFLPKLLLVIIFVTIIGWSWNISSLLTWLFSVETSFSDHDKSLHISDSRIPVGALQARKEDIFFVGWLFSLSQSHGRLLSQLFCCCCCWDKTPWLKQFKVEMAYSSPQFKSTLYCSE